MLNCNYFLDNNNNNNDNNKKNIENLKSFTIKHIIYPTDKNFPEIDKGFTILRSNEINYSHSFKINKMPTREQYFIYNIDEIKKQENSRYTNSYNVLLSINKPYERKKFNINLLEEMLMDFLNEMCSKIIDYKISIENNNRNNMEDDFEDNINHELDDDDEEEETDYVRKMDDDLKNDVLNFDYFIQIFEEKKYKVNLVKNEFIKEFIFFLQSSTELNLYDSKGGKIYQLDKDLDLNLEQLILKYDSEWWRSIQIRYEYFSLIRKEILIGVYSKQYIRRMKDKTAISIINRLKFNPERLVFDIYNDLNVPRVTTEGLLIIKEKFKGSYNIPTRLIIMSELYELFEEKSFNIRTFCIDINENGKSNSFFQKMRSICRKYNYKTKKNISDFNLLRKLEFDYDVFSLYPKEYISSSINNKINFLKDLIDVNYFRTYDFNNFYITKKSYCVMAYNAKISLHKLKTKSTNSISINYDYLTSKLSDVDDKYTYNQTKAIYSILNSNIVIITGEAGTGKTDILKEYCKLFNIKNLLVVSQQSNPMKSIQDRIPELINKTSTIDRICLSIERGTKNGLDIQNKTKVLFIEEAGTMCTLDFIKLLNYLNLDKIIFSGGLEQSFPIGQGEVFRELVETYKDSDFCIELKKIHRVKQDKALLLLNNQHILNGDYNKLDFGYNCDSEKPAIMIKYSNYYDKEFCMESEIERIKNIFQPIFNKIEGKLLKEKERNDSIKIFFGDEEEIVLRLEGRIIKKNYYIFSEEIIKSTFIMCHKNETRLILSDAINLWAEEHDKIVNNTLKNNQTIDQEIFLTNQQNPTTNIQLPFPTLSIQENMNMANYYNDDDINNNNNNNNNIINGITKIKKILKVNEFVTLKKNQNDNEEDRAKANYLRTSHVANGFKICIKEICDYDVTPGLTEEIAEATKINVISTIIQKQNKSWDRIIIGTDTKNNTYRINIRDYGLSNIEKGSASTIASEQGKETKYGIVYFGEKESMFLNRNQVYVALTREIDGVYVVNYVDEKKNRNSMKEAISRLKKKSENYLINGNNKNEKYNHKYDFNNNSNQFDIDNNNDDVDINNQNDQTQKEFEENLSILPKIDLFQLDEMDNNKTLIKYKKVEQRLIDDEEEDDTNTNSNKKLLLINGNYLLSTESKLQEIINNQDTYNYDNDEVNNINNIFKMQLNSFQIKYEDVYNFIKEKKYFGKTNLYNLKKFYLPIMNSKEKILKSRNKNFNKDYDITNEDLIKNLEKKFKRMVYDPLYEYDINDFDVSVFSDKSNNNNNNKKRDEIDFSTMTESSEDLIDFLINGNIKKPKIDNNNNNNNNKSTNKITSDLLSLSSSSSSSFTTTIKENNSNITSTQNLNSLSEDSSEFLLDKNEFNYEQELKRKNILTLQNNNKKKQKISNDNDYINNRTFISNDVLNNNSCNTISCDNNNNNKNNEEDNQFEQNFNLDNVFSNKKTLISIYNKYTT